MLRGYQCGMTWGAALAAGAQAYQLFGSGPQAETMALIAAQRLVGSFCALNNYVNCREITGFDTSSPATKQILLFLIKSVFTGGCFRMAARFAQAAFSEIDTVLSEKHKAPAPPTSCAAMLAQKMGVSDMHTVMAAGFAGGIGLGGSGCGALGVAIWISGMNSLEGQDGKIGYNDPRALDAVERFVKCTDHKFKCSEIIGRKFEHIDDHANYLRDGGCSEIIKVLATQ